jgi:MurNAc alpha-1-phosphate uridylyltransferase
MAPRAMLLAAGRGERMRPLTEHMPKPLLKVGNKPLIVWHLERLASAGISEVVINVSWCGEQLRSALGNGAAFGLSIQWVDEGPEPLETAGGIRNALPLLGEAPFMVINADIFTDGLPSLILPTDRLAHLLLVPNPIQHLAGDFGLEAGELRLTGARRYTFSGMGIYSPALFADLAPGRRPLRPVLDRALHAGLISASVFDGQWVDVGTPERLMSLNSTLASARHVIGHSHAALGGRSQ